MSGQHQRSYPEVKEIGLTELFVPEGEILADLIFVHGLKGHPRKTWEHDNSQAHSKLSFLRKSKRGTRGAEGCYWPLDLLPCDFKRLRILTYGYDSHPSHFYRSTTNQMTISQHGRDLLTKVVNCRQDCMTRPLVFIAHSLGGILVKDAIVESNKHVHQKHVQAVAEQCRAIFFFGTPHQGSSFAEWGLLLSNIVGALPAGPSMYNGVLRGLSPESEKLDNLKRDFDDILDAEIPTEQKIKLFTFQEGKGIGRLATFQDKVVPDASSTFGRRNLEESSFVNENHMNMCRFKDKSDPAYDDFKAKLSRLLGALPERIETTSRGKGGPGETRSGDHHEKTIDKYIYILEKLNFEGRKLRESQLGNLPTHTETLNWIWKSIFGDWLTKDDQNLDHIFWIFGKPASGKSTLMHYISEDETLSTMLCDVTQQKWLIVYHFFDFRASEGIRNNFEGFLRSLLYQLLKNGEQSIQKDTLKVLDQHLWSIGHLRQALQSNLKQSPRPIFLLLDGLDEYKGSQWELVQFLRQIAGSNVRLCLASRPEPVFEAAFENIPRLKMQDFNRAAIETFVKLTLEQSLADSSFFDDDEFVSLSRNIGQRADGMFLWARFATYELAEGFARGENLSALERRLEQLPPELEDIYSRIFTKLEPRERQEAGRMLQLICSSEKTLNTEELMAAMEYVRAKSRFRLTKLSRQKCRQFERNIISLTGGVLEVHNNKISRWITYTFGDRGYINTVQITHKTVLTYLESRGWQEILPDIHDGLMHSEALWLHVCIGQFVSEINGPNWIPDERPQGLSGDACPPKHLDFSTSFSYSAPLSSVPDKAENTAPLREYAALHIFDHAAKFEEEVRSPAMPFIKDSVICSLLRFHWFFQLHSLSRCSCFVDDYPSIIPRRPIHVAIAHKLALSVSMQLSEDTSSRSLICDSHRLPCWLPENYITLSDSTTRTGLKLPNNCGFLQASTDFFESFPANGEEMSVLEFAVRVASFYEDFAVLEGVLQSNPLIDDSATIAALKSGDLGMLRSLLPHTTEWKTRFVPEQDPNTFQISKLRIGEIVLSPVELELLSSLRIAQPAFTPLWIFLRHANEVLNERGDCMAFFQERGDEVNAQCGPFGTALHSVVSHECSLEMIEFLIEAGGDVHAEGLLGNPLEYAWRLLNSDQDGVGFHTLARAHAVRVLIDNGAINKYVDPNGCVPTQDWMLYVSNFKPSHKVSSSGEYSPNTDLKILNRCKALYAGSDPYPMPPLHQGSESDEEDDDKEEAKREQEHRI